MRASIPVEDLIVGARLLARLPTFLRHPLRVEDARAALTRRFEQRSAAFLALVRRAVFENARSPYRPLLDRAGCTEGDLARLVARDGPEGAMQVLFEHGVYLTVDEFKGRRPVVRGNLTLAIHPRALQNPASTAHVPVRTGGSRGAALPVPIDLAFLADRAVDTLLGLHVRGGSHWVKAHWQVPGAGAVARILEFSRFGAPVARWFTQVDPAAAGLDARYRWSGRMLRWGSLLAGVPLPWPEHVPVSAPLPVARWMASVLGRGATPHLFTFASSAVRLCRAAAEAGIELPGARLTVTGEPLTEARLAVIRAAGAEAVPRYAVMECGALGLGCLRPREPDEVHLLHDLHAVIQPGPNGIGADPRPLYVSSLSPTAPFVLLNVSMGDQAVVETAPCGCPLERLGWTRRLHTIRSPEKLTSGGVTFLDTDVIRVLDQVLPRALGGGPTDYQLVEDEDTQGVPCLRLIVHPAVGPLDPTAVARTFLDALGAGSGVERVMGLLWRDAQLLRVERRPPRVTAAGKILHLHVVRSSPHLGEGVGAAR